jgi:hypothetical protein
MAYRLDAYSGVGLDEALLRLVIDEHRTAIIPRLEQHWAYYRNPSTPVGVGSPGRLAQEAGLPTRLTGHGGAAGDDRSHREIVIENDIAWRVHTMVDFMFGKPITLVSTARDEQTRRTIERVLDAVWEASGGIALLQDMALLGHVHGHVDLLMRVDGRLARMAGGAEMRHRRLEAAAPDGDKRKRLEATGSLTGKMPVPLDVDASRLAELVRVEVIEPTRGIPIMDPSDYRRLLAYVIHFERELNAVDEARGAGGLGRLIGRRGTRRRRRSSVTEIISGTHWQRYEDERLVEESALGLTGGRVPVVHVQNVSQPFRYGGLGEVEPLIPLQDELNTRLSDRASRVTMQSFKMYLAKGLDGFDQTPIGPGQFWSTDNPDASIEAFGGDASSPSEESHIEQVREAMDKVSGVPPLASGVVRAKIGNLSSANALRITLMGVLSKTARKRVSYGRGIAQMSELILTALDTAGLLRTDRRDRGVRIEWSDPLPMDLDEQMRAAKTKLEIGVPRERVISELGYAPTDPGLT